jgi:hypothetical protein
METADSTANPTGCNTIIVNIESAGATTVSEVFESKGRASEIKEQKSQSKAVRFNVCIQQKSGY